MSQILSEKRNNLGIITLNSEKTLNSLSLPMAEKIQSILNDWNNDDEVSCIFLQGSGERAFCAGGDVRQMYNAIIAQREIDATKLPQACYNFFSKEYELDYTIHRYPKPIIVWGNGIVMGGGIGLMVGASHRIVTETSKVAMPEITIGLYPDVAGTYFLNKMPSAYGLYVGLTATRLDGADCKFLNLADYYILSEAKNDIITALENAKWGNNSTENNKIISDILENKSKGIEIPESQAETHSSFIAQFEGVKSVLEFRDILVNYPEKDNWINAGLKIFESGSPSSAFVIFKQLQDGKDMNLEEVFRSELNLSCQCGLHPDFAEGVRALLVDKDQNPKWSPASLNDVTEEWVNSYFTDFSKEENLE